MGKKIRAWQRLDPRWQQEMEKYGGHAVPSREYIALYLEERGELLTFEALCAAFELADHEVEPFARRLKAMEREGQLIRNRRAGYGIVKKMDLVPGRVVGHPDGHGLLIPDEGGDALGLSAREMRSLIHGDRALVRPGALDPKGRRQATVVEVLERNTERLVGRFMAERGVGVVLPANRRIPHEILIPPEESHGAEHGQVVIVELLVYPDGLSRPRGRVVEILGSDLEPGMEIKIAIASHNLPDRWPPAVEAAAAALPGGVDAAALHGRVDLRPLPLVTIDGETARDFDDAVFAQQRGENWRLIVAIADVSHYVGAGAALDTEAHRRGTSVYFPNQVLPMLPEALSNGLCSLNPLVDRLCIACDMTINPAGRIIRSHFVEAVMHSKARLTYTRMAKLVAERDPALRAEYAELLPHLDALLALYSVLAAARKQRGAMDFDKQETEIHYDEHRKIAHIVPSERNVAHKIIEECMIAANVAAARFLVRHRMPGLYRVHDRPNPEKLLHLREFLSELALGLGGGETPTAQDYGRLMHQIRDRPDAHLIQTMLLRSMMQAVYHPKNIGHFGLALDEYAHFTSPIRRYPDLLVHRAIRHVLQGGTAKTYRYTADDMVHLGEHCSMTERRADDATREVIDWLKCEFMQHKVGETFEGLITAVTSFGVFVELRTVFVEGLVHVTALPNDYYHYDGAGQRLRGERTGRTFRLGDPIAVQVARVDLDQRRIDFEPVIDPKQPLAATDDGGAEPRFKKKKARR